METSGAGDTLKGRGAQRPVSLVSPGPRHSREIPAKAGTYCMRPLTQSGCLPPTRLAYAKAGTYWRAPAYAKRVPTPNAPRLRESGNLPYADATP